MNNIIIAIDGPAGSGKSTTAKSVAQKLGYIYIDTGAMYRAVTLAWISSGREMAEDVVCNLMKDIEIDIVHTNEGQLTLLNGKDVSKEIRLPEVTARVSEISAMGCVRELLVEQQRKIAKDGGAILDGRDIGTVVFPNAELKIFLIASAETRAIRRALELKEKGNEIPVDEIKKQIIQRDNHDSSRSNSPLRKAEDAIEIDTSHLTIEEQVDKVVSLTKKVIGAN